VPESRPIPLLVTVNQANGLIDAWEALHDEHELTTHRYQDALEIIDWLRLSLTAMGVPPRYSRNERASQTFRNFVLRSKFALLRWLNHRQVIAVYITEEERLALRKFLVLQRPPPELRTLIERLQREAV
jgi:hypothetical protein